MGGFEYIARAITLSCDSTRFGFFLIFAHHGSRCRCVGRTSPLFFAKDCASATLMSVFNKDSDRLRIALTITRGEALVRHVEGRRSDSLPS